MPLPININDLLHGASVEWARLEFKEGWNPEVVLRTICAFANDFHNLGGGYIIVGVAERDGRPILPPIGISPDQIDAIQKEILNFGYHAIQPAYHPISSPYQIDGATILVIWAPGGQTRPYKAKLSLAKETRDYGYFIRKQSSTVRAKGAEEAELLALAATVPFDDRINQRAKIDDLDKDLIREFLTDVGSDLADGVGKMPLIDLGRQMNIVDGPSEAPFPLNVGLLFFNATPHRFFPVTQIDVVWFPEGAQADTFTEKIFKGPLHYMIRETLDYIRRNYITEIVVKHPGHAEATRAESIPFDAIEEAVVNAVYHRSYQVREPIEIRIYPEEMVILSYPGPDRSVELDQLKLGRAMARQYRNRRIGEFLKELKLTEGRSTGIPKILRVMRNNGSPAPQFKTDSDYSFFAVHLPVRKQHKGSKAKHISGPNIGNKIVGTKSGHNADQFETVQEWQQVEILRQCGQESEITDLMALVQRTDRTKFRNQVLKPLLVAGLLEMTIPDKPTSSKQRYRLTEKGAAAVKGNILKR